MSPLTPHSWCVQYIAQSLRRNLLGAADDLQRCHEIVPETMSCGQSADGRALSKREALSRLECACTTACAWRSAGCGRRAGPSRQRCLVTLGGTVSPASRARALLWDLMCGLWLV